MVKDDGVNDENRNDFVEYFKTKTMGYNDYVIRQHKDLHTICMNDKTMESDSDKKKNTWKTHYFL